MITWHHVVPIITKLSTHHQRRGPGCHVNWLALMWCHVSKVNTTWEVNVPHQSDVVTPICRIVHIAWTSKFSASIVRFRPILGVTRAVRSVRSCFGRFCLSFILYRGVQTGFSLFYIRFTYFEVESCHFDPGSMLF